MKNLGDEVARSRINKTWLEKLYYQYPPRLADSDKVPQNVASRLRDGGFDLKSRFENNDVSRLSSKNPQSIHSGDSFVCLVIFFS